MKNIKLCIYPLVALMALLGLSAWLIPLIWSPEWVGWTRNAYRMAQAGVWQGIDAYAAVASHFFISFYGRTAATVMLASGCFILLIIVVYKSFIQEEVN